MNDGPTIPKTYETISARRGTDAFLDSMMGLVDPIQTLQRIYDSTPIEAIEYLYGAHPPFANSRSLAVHHGVVRDRVG